MVDKKEKVVFDETSTNSKIKATNSFLEKCFQKLKF
jgi:hypothetical protein